MMTSNNFLSDTEILAAATNVLCKNGFSEVNNIYLKGINHESHRLFEDAYSIVAVVVFPSWQDLFSGWIDTQTVLVDLISEHVSQEEEKAWEGYLAMLTTSLVPKSEMQHVERIRYDTTRIRKLIATGVQLKEVSDIRDALLPLLPLEEQMEDSPADAVLNRLPHILQDKKLSEDVIGTVINAFLKHEPLIESLHKYRLTNET